MITEQHLASLRDCVLAKVMPRFFADMNLASQRIFMHELLDLAFEGLEQRLKEKENDDT